MGRRPEPKSDKIARGTYRPDRDKSMTVALADEVPDPPAGLGEAGRQFWAEAYAVPWVTASNRTMVHLIARKLDERQMVADQFHQALADYFRQQRTLKEIDRDVASGLDQLLLKPNARRRAGIETADSAEIRRLICATRQQRHGWCMMKPLTASVQNSGSSPHVTGNRRAS